MNLNADIDKDLGAKTESKTRIVIIAVGILLGFFVISKLLSSISSNPAQQTYEFRCASCHGFEGEGLKDMIPPLANADWLAENQDRLVCVLKNGMDEKIMVNGKEYHQEMTGQNLNDIQIMNIINYINTSWGNDFPETTTDKVMEKMAECD